MSSGKAPQAPAVLINRWILSRLARAIGESTRGIQEFRLDEGSAALYHFFWGEFCDWYIELTKPIFNGNDDAQRRETKETLARVIETALRALHPFMPFITEELWQKVPRPETRPVSIALGPYPSTADGRVDEPAERLMTALMQAVSAARTVRSEHDVKDSVKVPLTLRTADRELSDMLSAQSRSIEFLVKTDGSPRIEPLGGERPRGTVLSVAGEIEVLVGLRGLVDPQKELERVERELKKLAKDLSGLEKRLSNPNFASNAPADVVAQARQQKAALDRQRARLEEARSLVSELG